MMKANWLLTGVLLLCSCGTGPDIALNERIFDLETSISMGRGCQHFTLGNGSRASSQTSASGILIAQQGRDDGVIVRIFENEEVLEERRYNEDFFRSGNVDEFTVTGANTALLLRYWGALAENGEAPCTPLEYDEP
jgi:hypothetical protein